MAAMHDTRCPRSVSDEQRASSTTPPISSLLNRLGTSPEVKMLLMSSTNVSYLICVSSKRNVVGLLVQPAAR